MDKILAIADELPGLRWVVVIDTTGMINYDHPKLTTFEKVRERGRAEAERPGAFDEMIASVRAEDPAFIDLHIGNDGQPQGRGDRPWQAPRGNPYIYHTLSDVDRGPPQVGCVPSAWPCDGTDFDHHPAFDRPNHPPLRGKHRRCTEDPVRGCAHIPVYGSAVHAKVRGGGTDRRRKHKSAEAGRLQHGLRLRTAACARLWEGKVKAWDKLIYRIAYLAAFRPILNKMGFDQLRLVITGGAAAGRELSALWQIWGLNMIEVYGQTETGGALITGQKGTFPQPGNVGTAPEGWDVRLGDDGEILVKSCDIFDGWWRNDGEPEKVSMRTGGSTPATSEIGRMAD